MIKKLTLRQIGVFSSYTLYHAIHNKYPTTPSELSEVTSSVLTDARFKYWDEWFYQHLSFLAKTSEGDGNG